MINTFIQNYEDESRERREMGEQGGGRGEQEDMKNGHLVREGAGNR